MYQQAVIPPDMGKLLLSFILSTCRPVSLRAKADAGTVEIPAQDHNVKKGMEGERLDNDPSGARYGCFLPDLTGLARRSPAPTSRKAV